MLIRHRIIIQLLAICLVFQFASVRAQSRWDGADDLPVSPLACPGQDENNDAERAANYDGGQVVNPPDLAGQPMVVVDVRPSVSMSYDRAIAEGMSAAAAELGNVELMTGTAMITSANQQAALVDEFVFGGVNGILFAAVDEHVDLASTLQAALNAGIHVIGYESDIEAAAREWFVAPAADNTIAKVLIDSLAEQIGSDASFAILTNSFDSPQAGRRIAELWAYAGQCYPDMEWLETAETDNDPTIAYNQAAVLFSDYGPDVNGLISVIITATPNAAQAVSQAGLCGSVAVVGLATPNDMKPHINGGCIQSAVLWDPADLGYASVYAMRAAADGTLQPGVTEARIGRLGTLSIENGSDIVLGEPLIFNAANINDYDF